jgi:hypothetical protein
MVENGDEDGGQSVWRCGVWKRMYSPPCPIETPLLSLIYLNFVFYHEFFSIIIFNMVTDYHLICSLILKFNNYMMNLDYNFFSACFFGCTFKGRININGNEKQKIDYFKSDRIQVLSKC